MGERIILSKNNSRIIECPYAKNINAYLKPHTKVNSKCIIDLNVRTQTRMLDYSSIEHSVIIEIFFVLLNIIASIHI